MGYTTVTPVAPGFREEDLVDMVKTRMDEIDHNALISVGTIDNYPITEMIETILNESKTDVLSSAPLSILPKVKKLYAGQQIIENQSTKCARIQVPDDALRIASIECSGWNRPVTKLKAADSVDMFRQGYKYIRATKNTPSAVVVDGTEFVMFPYNSGNTVTIIYISSQTRYDALEYKAINAVCWNCAMKVFAAMGMSENYSRCSEIYQSMLK